jgi:phosphoglycolate phosphatase-like HAD superfamily hydrolase
MRPQTFFHVCFSVFLLASFTSQSDAGDEFVYPGDVTVRDFRAEQMMYKPGEPVRFVVDFTAHAPPVNGKTPPLTLEISIEQELSPPFVAVRQTAELKPGVQRAELVWQTGGRDVYGHRATLHCRDAFGRVLAEAETLFDVADDWTPVMRLAAMEAAGLARPDRSQEDIDANIKMLRQAHINAVEAFTTTPRPYLLTPKERAWPYQYGENRLVSADVLRAWGKALHRNGMKFILYNEMSAITGPDAWKIWDDSWPKPRLITTYFAEKGMFNPNMLAIKDDFADQLAASIREYGWDGILMDSVGGAYRITAEGFNQAGERLTDLSIGEVSYRFLSAARQKARAENPDFRFLSQSAPQVSLKGIADSTSEIFGAIMRRAELLGLRRYSQANDMYTAEFDSHTEPRDGRYPLTYEAVLASMNSIRAAVGQPLMAWAHLSSPDYSEYSVAFVRPYLAAHFAARTQTHDHFGFYSGALSDGAGAPVSRQITRYNRFASRFSYYLFSPELHWLIEPDAAIRVSATRPILWDKTVYQRTTASGQRQMIIHLLNLPDDHHALGQKQIPPMAQNIAIRLPANKPMSTAWFLSADDDALQPLPLLPEKNADSSTTWRLPPLDCWGMVIMVEQ